MATGCRAAFRFLAGPDKQMLFESMLVSKKKNILAPEESQTAKVVSERKEISAIFNPDSKPGLRLKRKLLYERE